MMVNSLPTTLTLTTPIHYIFFIFYSMKCNVYMISTSKLVAWEKVCLLMEEGGLGIRRVGLFNQALLGKWLWWFGKEVHRLWHQVIATKYGVDSGGWCTRDV